MEEEKVEFSREQIIEAYHDAENKLMPSKRKARVAPIEDYITDIFSDVVEGLTIAISSTREGKLELAEVAAIQTIISLKAKGIEEIKDEDLKNKALFTYDIMDSFYVKAHDYLILTDYNNTSICIPLSWFEEKDSRKDRIFKITKLFLHDVLYHFGRKIDDEISKTKTEISVLELKLKEMEKAKEKMDDNNKLSEILNSLRF